MPIMRDLELLERNVPLPDGHLPAAGPGAAHVALHAGRGVLPTCLDYKGFLFPTRKRESHNTCNAGMIIDYIKYNTE